MTTPGDDTAPAQARTTPANGSATWWWDGWLRAHDATQLNLTDWRKRKTRQQEMRIAWRASRAGKRKMAGMSPNVAISGGTGDAPPKHS